MALHMYLLYFKVNRSIEWIVEYAQRTKKKIWLSGKCLYPVNIHQKLYVFHFLLGDIGGTKLFNFNLVIRAQCGFTTVCHCSLF